MSSQVGPVRPRWALQVPAILSDHDESFLLSEAGSARLNYAMYTSRTYASAPQLPSGFVHSASSSGLSGRYHSDTESSLPGQAVHEDCKKLEASNRMMRCIFWVLVTACVLVILVYLGLIVFLFASLHELGKSPSTQKNQKNCVGEKQVEEFWMSYDNKNEDVNDFLKKIAGFDYSTKDERYCFENLTWVPRLMGKIKAKVQGNMNYIEDQQRQIKQTVSSYISANCTHADSSEDMARTDSSRAVFAQFFLNATVYKRRSAGGGTISLPWISEGSTGSTKRGIDVDLTSGVLTIKHSGFYYIYSHVVFKTDQRNHIVSELQQGHDVTLLENQEGPVSLLQGVFMLQANDTLVVKASGPLRTENIKSNYFGLYLIRT